MAINDSLSRYVRLKEWMTQRNITFTAIGERLGVSGTAVRLACREIPARSIIIRA